MEKRKSVRYILLLSILAINQSFLACSNQVPKGEKTVSSMSQSDQDLSDTVDEENQKKEEMPHSEAAPHKQPKRDKNALYLNNKSITPGESADSIINKFGSPNRIAETEYDFDYYIYNNNYSRLLFVAIREGKVVGFYTDSVDFEYKGIDSTSDLGEVNKILDRDYPLDSVLTYQTDTYTLNILMDTVKTNTVTGISLMPADVKEEAYDRQVMREIELMIYDLTNSIRKRNGVAVLSWSSSAANAARKHSLDMAEGSYFSHFDPTGKDPGDRIREEGIAYEAVGENIIAGYGTAIISTHAWFNSPEHRDNILSPNYRYLGVGFTYMEESQYQTYITQDFYR